MKQSIKLLLGGAFLLSLPMVLTSCEDILGEWDKPAPVNVIVTPDDGGGATALNTYLVWNGVDALEAQTIPATAIDAETGITSTTIASGTYIVKKDLNLSGNYQFTGDVDLILSDNTTLTITGSLNADTWGTHKLKIYAQSEGDDKGKLVINTSTTDGISITCGDIEIHGGDINVSSTVYSGGGGTMGLETQYDLNIYGGKVTAFGTMEGINAYGNLYIYSGEINATAGASGGQGGKGIMGTITINGGTVTATGGDGVSGAAGGAGMDGTITINNCTKVTSTGGDGTPKGACYSGPVTPANTLKYSWDDGANYTNSAGGPIDFSAKTSLIIIPQ